MSIRDDSKLIQNFKEIEDTMSMTIKINHNQVIEIVVADLMAKYKASLKFNDEYKQSFEKVLRFYLDDEEFNEMLDLF